jgi:hypothetical protein
MTPTVPGSAFPVESFSAPPNFTNRGTLTAVPAGCCPRAGTPRGKQIARSAQGRRQLQTIVVPSFIE